MVESSEPQDLVTVLISVGVQTAIAFGLIFAFSLLRPANKVVYQPRLKFAPESKRPKALGPEPTAWISPIFSVNENASIALLGLDAVMFLRYLKFLLRLFTILFLFGVPMIFIYFFYARIVGKPADTGVSLAPVNNVNNGVQISQAVITRTTARTVSGTVFNEAVTSTIDFTLTTTATSGILTSNAPSSSAATDAPTTNVATTDAASITEAPVVTDAPVPSVTDAAPVPSTTAEAAPAVRANFNQRFHGFHLGKRNDDDLTGAVPAQVAFGLKHKVVLGHGMDVELLRRDLERRDVNLSAIKFPNPSLANLTMSMIDVDHPMYWLPASLTWLISIIVYLSLLHVWMDYIKFRKQYFVSDEFQKEFHHRLLLLTNLPDSLTDSESLLKYMSSLGLKYPPKAAIINRNAGDLSKLIVKHEKATKSLEAILAKYLDNPDNLPAERPTMKDASGSKVDAISHLSNEINELEERIYALRAIPDSSLRPTASAFVAFESIKGAHSAARKIRENPTILIQGHIITPPKIKPSPALSEVVWENVDMTPAERYPRRLIALGLVIALTVIWTFFVAAVTLLEDLRAVFKGNDAVLKFLNQNSQITVILQGFLAPIILAIALALLPMILKYISWFQGISSSHGIMKSVLYKLFFFQVYQVFMSTVFKALQATLSSNTGNTGAVTDIYRKTVTDALVQIGNKSSAYIALFGTYFAGYGIEIIQAASFIMNFIRRRFFKSTPRQLYEINLPPEFNFAVIYGSVALAFTVALTFSVIAPIILIFALIFFFLAYLVMKYQFMYVYEVRRETGGTWWPKVFNLLMIGVGFFQIITLSTVFTANIGSKSNQKQWALLTPLPFITGALWFATVRFIAPRAQYISKKDTANFDPSPLQPLTPTSDDVSKTLEDRALNPAFVKPLLKVWVWKRSSHLLPQLHSPRYMSLDDYVRKHPEAAAGSREKRRKMRLFASSETAKRDRKQLKARAAVMAGDSDAAAYEADMSKASSVADMPNAASYDHLVRAEDVEDELPPEEMGGDAGSAVSSRPSEDMVSPVGVMQGYGGGYGSPQQGSPQQGRYQQNPANLQQQYRYNPGAYEMGNTGR